LPGAPAGALLLPLAVGLEVAVVALVAQVEAEAADLLALLHHQLDFGLVAVGQEANLVVDVGALGRQQRGTEQQGSGGQQQGGAVGHGGLPRGDFPMTRRTAIRSLGVR